MVLQLNATFQDCPLSCDIPRFDHCKVEVVNISFFVHKLVITQCDFTSKHVKLNLIVKIYNFSSPKVFSLSIFNNADTTESDSLAQELCFGRTSSWLHECEM